MTRALLSIFAVLAAVLSIAAPGCGLEERGENDSFTFSREVGSGNLGDKVLLPLEVLGGAGYRVEVEFEVKNPDGINRLYIQGHRLAFNDSSTNKKRGTKGSVRLNGGAWIEISDDNADLYEPEASFGGIDGAYYTVRLTMPITGVVKGDNLLEFRLNETDGTSLGYRILDFNLLRAGERVLKEKKFVEEDPSQWQPPLPGAGDIAQGKTLWETAVLTESPLSQDTLRATCADCHARDGRDLKYFNYSNWSIQARAEFHGINPKNAERIASYIRSLDVPAPIGARPWNPPYQPGPGLDSQPAEEWAAGAGLEAVLDDDGDMIPYLFPQGTNLKKIRRELDVDGVLNLRELPLALQFPDWNAWLPAVHGKDLWGNTWSNSLPEDGYEDALQELQTVGVDALIANGQLENTLRRISSGAREFIRTGQTEGKSEAWRVVAGTIIDARDKKFSRELTKVSLTKWAAVKQWELVQEFGLASTAPELHGEELRAWPGIGWSAFPIAPHMVSDNLVNFEWQTKVIGKYQSTAWYQLQMTLNSGQRVLSANRPVDWKYQFRHIIQLESASGVAHPLRLAASIIKGYQNMNNGDGPTKQGWKMQEVHPLWYYSETSNERTVVIDRLNDYKNGLRGKVLTALIDGFVDVSAAIPDDEWERCDHGSEQDTAYCIEPATHIPALPKKKFFAVPEDFHADNFYRLLPLLKDKGVKPKSRRALADWCERMWPNGDWHSML